MIYIKIMAIFESQDLQSWHYCFYLLWHNVFDITLTNNSESKSVHWQHHLMSKLQIKVSIYVGRLRNSVSHETINLIWDRNNIRFSIFVEYFSLHEISNFAWMKYMYITDYFSCYKVLWFWQGKKNIYFGLVFSR